MKADSIHRPLVESAESADTSLIELAESDSNPPPPSHWLNRPKADSSPRPPPSLVESAESGQRIRGCQMAPLALSWPPSRKAGDAHDQLWAFMHNLICLFVCMCMCMCCVYMCVCICVWCGVCVYVCVCACVCVCVCVCMCVCVCVCVILHLTIIRFCRVISKPIKSVQNSTRGYPREQPSFHFLSVISVANWLHKRKVCAVHMYQ